jgi:diphosphomevalonate decarboxylase
LSSANNFPSDCGLASSASSFAALTKATHELALERSLDRAAAEAVTLSDLSELTRRGSGSSCRSLFAPWSIWRTERAEALRLPWAHLHHQVVLLEKNKKSVSSSEAHARVSSSPLFQGRAARAEKRLQQLLEAMNQQDWFKSCQLVWSDFWDMHALFETSEPHFGYMKAGSLAVLEMVEETWRTDGDGPMATMDAGANVHLLYRPDQISLARKMASNLTSLGSLIESTSLYSEGR